MRYSGMPAVLQDSRDRARLASVLPETTMEVATRRRPGSAIRQGQYMEDTGYGLGSDIDSDPYQTIDPSSWCNHRVVLDRAGGHNRDGAAKRRNGNGERHHAPRSEWKGHGGRGGGVH